VVGTVGVPGATLGPHVQRVRVGLVPFVRGRVDFQFHCEKNGQHFTIVNNMIVNNIIFQDMFKGIKTDAFLQTKNREKTPLVIT